MNHIALLIIAEPAQENIQIKQIEYFLKHRLADVQLDNVWLTNPETLPQIINNHNFSIVYFSDYSDQMDYIKLLHELTLSQPSNFIIVINRRKNWETWLKSSVKAINPAKLFYEINFSKLSLLS